MASTRVPVHLSVLDCTVGTSIDAEVALDRQEDGLALIVTDGSGAPVVACSPVQPEQLWQAGPSTYLVRSTAAPNSDTLTYILEPRGTAAAATMQRLAAVVKGSSTSTGGVGQQSHFEAKTDKGSAELYFHYYGMLQHQQNMLQDYIRTGTYYAAILENKADFEGKAVMDVGCGSGILSLFAAQAGARVVYAVEASDMAHFARQLAAANPGIGDRIKVLHGKVEELVLPEKVDVLVSEPMGTLLVNERMIESYVYARNAFLKPGGKMYPRLGRIHLAAFCDELLFNEVAHKSLFFANPSFYGVDLSCLQQPATASYFSQVVVDQIPPNVLVSNCVTRTFDFLSCTEAELQEITIPVSVQVAVPCTVHGIASWFDVLFDGSESQRWLSTAPGLPITHWFQLRCVLDRPLVIATPGATISGEMRLVAHSRQSYDIHLSLRAPPLEPGGEQQESSFSFDLKEPHYRQLTQWAVPAAAAAAPAAEAAPAAALNAAARSDQVAAMEAGAAD